MRRVGELGCLSLPAGCWQCDQASKLPPPAAAAAGSVPNILNTVSKLEAFPWNDTAAAVAALAPQARQQQQQQQGKVAAAAAGCVLLCPICLAPLADDELPGGAASSTGLDGSVHTSVGSRAAQAAGCCMSCSSQILGNSAGSGGRADSGVAPNGGGVAAALPAAVQRQMAALAAAGARCNGSGGSGIEQLRSQIAEFLLE